MGGKADGVFRVYKTLKSAVNGEEGDHVCRAERDALHGALEKRGLIIWKRGGGSHAEGKQEIIS